MSTLVELTCRSVKKSQNWDKKHPNAFEIELEVPYDQKSIFHKLSGGTNIVLRTINEKAAEEFEIGEVYEMVLSKKQVAAAADSAEA